MQIVSIVGARPQFIKLAPVARAFNRHPSVTHKIVHTGQHYDDRMSKVFFDELELPKPHLDLAVGSGSHGAQTGAMLEKLEQYMTEKQPDVVLVYGDTNSTLAATLAATKLNIFVAHIEAGLRSFNREMPEEINRLVADHCSDILYAPTPRAMHNLADENLLERAIQSGDVMRDAVLHNRTLAKGKSGVLKTMGLEAGKFGLLTLHRAGNTSESALRELLPLLNELAESALPLVFPMHPRTQAVLSSADIRPGPGLRVTEPFGYLDMIQVVEAAAVVITDSGGVQKEAAFLATPCITLREETEWTETVEIGINRLVGRDPDRLRQALSAVLDEHGRDSISLESEMDEHYGRGDAAEIIARDLLHRIGNTE